MAEKKFDFGQDVINNRHEVDRAKQEERAHWNEVSKVQLAAVKNDPALFAAYLDTSAVVPSYSPGNIARVMAQTPEGTTPCMIRTAEDWRKLGRSILGKESGMTISCGNDKYGIVYDISQTYGPDVPAQALKSSDEITAAMQALYNALPNAVTPLLVDDLEDTARYSSDGRDAVLMYRPIAAKEIRRAFFETAREVFHARNNKYQFNGPYRSADFTVEANCTAYILCRRYGVESPGLNFEALGKYNQGMDDLNFDFSLKIISKNAKELEAAIYKAVSRDRGITPEAPRRDQKIAL